VEKKLLSADQLAQSVAGSILGAMRIQPTGEYNKAGRLISTVFSVIYKRDAI
jgi:hypothetical protein